MSKIKDFILNNIYLAKVALYFRKLQKDITLYFHTSIMFSKALKESCPKVFYIGIPAHSNLGDLAQGVCIRKWLLDNYRDRHLIEIETNSLVNTRFSLLNKLSKTYNMNRDIIVFQSGYTTTDLGGFADEMHKKVIQRIPKARILMMPQTIFFKSKERESETAKVYSQASSMLFLARDKVSYEKAKELFPTLCVKLFPDIVTTKIGEKQYNISRKGILFCCRNDEEKYYSDYDINVLIKRCSEVDVVEKTDTTKNLSAGYMVKNAERLVQEEINHYSRYKLIITDRYHGTIFSLAAGTPVIIIKTTDHKVITGADWFKDVYNDYVHVAKDLDDAFELTKKCYAKKYRYFLKPYFKNEYYDKLKPIFDGIAGGQ